MSKRYQSATNLRDPRPRSERLRKNGGAQGGGSSSTVVEIHSSSSPAGGDGHTHQNKEDLDKLSVSGSYVNVLVDQPTEEGSTEKVRQKASAGWADEAGHAEDADHADDSDAWEGHDFDDFMNQPVRSTDQVQFVKVTTPHVVSPGFSEGALGAGFRMYIDHRGHAVIEADDITIRKTAKFFELIIQQLKHQGGMVIYSAGAMECTGVEELENGYKCYFDTKDGQIPNEFVVGDQARCNRFNLATTTAKYYWRLVTAVGADYIILSKTDCDTGSAAPEAGDNIIQLGHRTDRNRQSAKITTTIDSNSPRDDYYEGINSYDLTGKNVTTVGVKDGRVGVWTQNGEFVGRVTITGGGGLNNLDEWNNLSSSVSSAWAEALAASEAAGAAQATANQAVRDAATAQAAADAAQAAAAQLSSLLSNWASDSKISPVEKEALRQQKTDIMTEYTEMVSRATRYGVGYSAFTAAYTLAAAALTKYTAATPEVITVEADYSNIAAYYTARADLLTAIAAAEKAATDAAQGAADAAQRDATAAQSTADRALAKAAAVEALLEQINDDTVLDLSEKNIIRTQWVTINGTEDLGRTGTKGSYVATRALAAIYGNVGVPEVVTYNGQEVTYNGQHIYYNVNGLSELNAAYLALREFLRGVGLNDRQNVFNGFDRARFAELLTNYNDAEIRAIDNVNRALSYQMSAFQDAVQQNIDEMRDQLDNTIEYHFGYHGVPTASNAPAVSWNTDALKKDHLGDVYYDEDTGYGYRWQKDASGTYYWKQLQDDAAIRALQLASLAKDTADGKRRVFLAQPTAADAYDPGDVWMHATIGSYVDEMLVCRTAKAAGTAFSASHWTTATKYTDDTVANQARDLANNASQVANNASNIAQQAQNLATAAKTAADAASEQLSNWASDSKISPVEKEALRQQKADVISEHAALSLEAQSYSISVTAFNAAYNAALAAFNKYTASTPETITVESDYANIAAYYSARATIAQAIAEKAKEAADAAADAAETAAAAAEEAGEAAAEAKEAADAVAEAVAKINVDAILDEAEKAEIRNTWTAINGIVSTGSMGQSGTYYAAKVMLAEDGREGFSVEITYNGREVTYNGEHIFYNHTGESRLDAAYLALREYLHACQINAPGVFAGFDRNQYAEFVRDYHVALNQVLQILSDVAKEAADHAALLAGNAQTAADAAAASATAANERLAAWAADNKISPTEKASLKRQKDDVISEHTAFVQAAGKYSISVTAFNTAYNAAVAAFNKYTAATPENIPIESDYGDIAAYYTARATIAQQIATEEKNAIDSAFSAAQTANTNIGLINQVLTRFASDGYISATEKRTLQVALQDESVNYVSILAQAQRYSTTAINSAKTTYIQKFTTFQTVVNHYTAQNTWADDIQVTNQYPLSAITEYYQAREDLIDLINARQKSYSEGYADQQVQAAVNTLSTAISEGDTGTLNAAIQRISEFGQTIIEGGYIKTNLINTDALVVKWMRTANNKVVINDDGSITAVDVNLTGTINATSGSFAGRIEAASGHIGGFVIGNGYIGLNTSAGGSPSSNGMSLYDSFISFYERDDDSYYGGTFHALIGSNVNNAWAARGLVRVEATGTGSQTQYDDCYGIQINVSGFRNPYAIYCTEGIFAGFRPQVDISNTSRYLTNMDTVVMCGNSNAVTFYLPSTPKHGQLYALVHTTTATMNISCNGFKTHPIMRVTSSGTTTVITTYSGSMETVLLVYNAHAQITYDGEQRTGVWVLTYLKV